MVNANEFESFNKIQQHNYMRHKYHALFNDILLWSKTIQPDSDITVMMNQIIPTIDIYGVGYELNNILNIMYKLNLIDDNFYTHTHLKFMNMMNISHTNDELLDSIQIQIL